MNSLSVMRRLRGSVVSADQANDYGHPVHDRGAGIILTAKKMNHDGDCKNDEQRVAAHQTYGWRQKYERGHCFASAECRAYSPRKTGP